MLVSKSFNHKACLTLPMQVSSMTRIAKLKTALTQAGFDGYLIFNGVNMLYFLGFPGTSALLVPPEGDPVVYVYSVNYEQAKAAGKRFNVQLVKSTENLLAKIVAQAKTCGVRKLCVDSLGVDAWRNLSKEFAGEDAVQVNVSFVQGLRKVKDREEIALMRRAGEITSEGMKAAAEAIKPGVKEYEVAGEIEYALRRCGAGPTAFETIVASGACSAFPHGGCSRREIRSGDLVVVDIGATFDYYCSDMTRTFVEGKPSAKQQKIYQTVLKAHDTAFEAIKAGAVIGSVDAAARKVIADAGYGEYFVHRLGHGVGLEVHEPPSLFSENKELLAAGNVVTDEPGIYIPGYGGVRIEDTVLVTAKDAEKLTCGPYSLCGV
jgi:Xaa-Pro aminopeptidase